MKYMICYFILFLTKVSPVTKKLILPSLKQGRNSEIGSDFRFIFSKIGAYWTWFTQKLGVFQTEINKKVILFKEGVFEQFSHSIQANFWITPLL